MADGFWADRASFRTPIPELDVAADLLASAADSLLAFDQAGARSYLEQANMPTLREYTRSIASQVTAEIHRVREVPGLPLAVPVAERGSRQPSPSVALEIFRRDGFRCRYCRCRVVLPKIEGVISALVPGAVRWGPRDEDLNAAFYTLKGVLDHVDPHAHGGVSDASNLVVACQPCNYGKGNWFVQQLGLSDPRSRSPESGDWDGLMRALPLRAKAAKGASKVVERASVNEKSARGRPAKRDRIAPSIENFTCAFSEEDRHSLDCLLELIDSLSDLGVSSSLGRVLLVRIEVKGTVLDALGIEPDTTVQVPWWIGPYKEAFFPFAETLAGGMTDAKLHETEKMWRVKSRGKLPRISELMENPAALRAAFQELHRALNNLDA